MRSSRIAMRLGFLIAISVCLVHCAGAAPQAPAETAAVAPVTAAPSAPSASASASASAPAVPEQQARALAIVRAIHGPSTGSPYASFGEEFRSAVTREKFDALVAEVESKVGELTEARVLDEERSGVIATVIVAAFFERGTRRYSVSLDADGVVRGLFIKPFADSAPTGAGPADDYVSKRLYTFPCRGRWIVGNGGREAHLNHHVGNKHQWYAYDLLRVTADGKRHTGDGNRNEDYPAWSEPVVAPADGTVVSVVDGVPDHGPDHTDRYFVPGNLVVIDHGDKEFSFIAHFQRGSIVVKPGARVKQGQRLGKTGNSGNSSAPHIHWHLATDPDMSRGHGLPIRLAPLIIDGARVEAPSPVRDQLIEP